MIDLRRTSRYYYLRLKRLRGTPHSLAMGAAIGAAIGITPTLPLHTIMIICTTLILRVNTIAGIILAAIISNPLTFLPQYWLAWRIGDWIFPDRLDWQRIRQVVELLHQQSLVDGLDTVSRLSFDAILVLMTGGVILAVPTGLLTYFLTLGFFQKIQKKRQQKHLLN